MDEIRWGILSTGGIAGRLADTLNTLEGAELLAVGSRSQASAERFGRAYGVPRRYDSYQALCADPDIDVVYVATPHTLHAENTLLALGHGKHVLCEKPFALNAAEARLMVEKAREQNLFLMEAMWTRFLPVMARLRGLLAEGAVGEVETVAAEFGFRASVGPEHRLLNPELGGGTLLDIGIYPLSFASMVLGRPQHIEADALIGPTGVDLEAEILLEYGGDRRAEIVTSFNKTLGNSARVYGSEGYLEVAAQFWQGQKLVLIAGDREEHLGLPFEGHGDQFQALEVHRCLREGLLQSPTMPLDESVALMETMDAIRAQWGLRYPSEREGA